MTISRGGGGGAEKGGVAWPAGMDPGKKLRVPGKGSPSRAGGPPGDLYLLIKVLPHAVFIRECHNLIVERKIPFTSATLGCKIAAPTLGGKSLNVKVAAGTQPTAKPRLKGRGLPAGPKGPRGDLFVRINLEVPKELSKAQKILLKDLQESGL